MKEKFLMNFAKTTLIGIALTITMTGSTFAMENTTIQNDRNDIKKVNSITNLSAIRALDVTADTNLGDSALPARFSLKDVISNNVVIKDQQQTSSCWTFAALSSLETNLAMQNYKNGKDTSKVYDFSERHMEYATSRDFANNTKNLKGFNRVVGSGGLWYFAQSYLTNGTGAIKESDMPFENNEDLINISQIQNKTVASTVYDTIEFEDYNSAYGVTAEQKATIMNKIKSHIKNYGSVYAQITTGSVSAYVPNDKYYNSATGALYFPLRATNMINHAVSIVGWDDNYSVSNFAEANRPTVNGAWIVRNTWGTDTGDNGLMYISYEDALVSTGLYGIIKASDTKDYENVYQYDDYMWNSSYYIRSTQIMLCNIFSKKTNEDEYITGIAFYAPETCTCKAYVNPAGSGKTKSDLKQVTLKEGATKTLDAGYHTLEFARPVKITGSSFAVAIEITAKNYPYFAVETKDTKYNDNVTIEAGKCFVGKVKSSFDYSTNQTVFEDGNVTEWIDLGTSLGSGEEDRGDSTLKALTVSAQNPLVKDLKAIKGDLNGDEKVTATDLLKMKKKIVGLETTSADDLEVGDMNGDNKITATDLLILKKIIVGLIK